MFIVPGLKGTETVQISKECRENAMHIYEAHEEIHAASRAASDEDWWASKIYAKNAKDYIKDTTGISQEIRDELNTSLKEVADMVESKDKHAVFPAGHFLDVSKELYLKVAVDCECKGNLDKDDKAFVQDLMASEARRLKEDTAPFIHEPRIAIMEAINKKLQEK